MEQDIPFDLIAKFLSGECSNEEISALNDWKNKRKEHIEIFNQMKKNWTEVPTPPYTPDVENALDKVSSKLPKQKKPVAFYNQSRFKIAAVLIIGLGLFGIYRTFWYSPEMKEISTLANSAPRNVFLPDGSKVILSKNSTLKFPERFNSKERRIEFTGEAYFEITPNKKKPFYIESDFAETKVVGTAFNLKILKNDSVAKVTVTEGIVSFNLKEHSKEQDILVQAGEVGKIDSKNKIITKEKNNDKNFMAWRDGKISFEDEKLGNALEVLSDYYGKTFIASDDLDSTIINAYFDSFSIPVAKEYMEQILDNVSVTEEGDKIILRTKSTK